MNTDVTPGIQYAAGQIVRLAQEGARLGQAEVDAIILTASVDVQRIERQLDLLLDLAFHPLHDTHLFQPRCGRVPLLTNLG